MDQSTIRSFNGETEELHAIEGDFHAYRISSWTIMMVGHGAGLG